MNPIEVIGLTKRFGDLDAVHDLSFIVQPGKVTGFLGPNGAGKSTTMRMILGLAEPDAGRALVFGQPYRDLNDPTRVVGAALESDSFHGARSGRDHLRTIATAAGLPGARVEDVLKLVELSGAARKAVRKYSLGMRQRLGLAAALLGEPDLLVLDEPANGLDPAGIRWLRELLRSWAQGGKAVLVSSHLLGEVAQLAEEVVVIDRGRLVTQSPVAELTAGARTLEDVFFELTKEEEIR